MDLTKDSIHFITCTFKEVILLEAEGVSISSFIFDDAMV